MGWQLKIEFVMFLHGIVIVMVHKLFSSFIFYKYSWKYFQGCSKPPTLIMLAFSYICQEWPMIFVNSLTIQFVAFWQMMIQRNHDGVTVDCWWCGVMHFRHILCQRVKIIGTIRGLMIFLDFSYGFNFQTWCESGSFVFPGITVFRPSQSTVSTPGGLRWSMSINPSIFYFTVIVWFSNGLDQRWCWVKR